MHNVEPEFLGFSCVLVGQNLLNEGRVNPLSKAHDEVFSRFASLLPLREDLFKEAISK